MPSPDTSNQLFQLATRFVNQTSRHIFLTGKAGTGKTTFLKYIKENSFKKMAVVAPTGVAAINAGGVTMHSLFQLPFGSFVPVNKRTWSSNQLFNTPHTLFKNLRLSTEKRVLLQELELLVIDEVSMLRADILDEIDLILKHFRKRPLVPFGGVQVLYIGDLFQLPPVTTNEEWEVLQQYYKSPFFFDAQVIQQAPPLYLELKKIYRQHEMDFIDLLNNIRNNEATETDLEHLHRHYKPGYEPPEEENFITLTTHNARAETINQNKLHKLPGNLHEFEAEISGDFYEKALPADKTLQLKEGVQVMFIKNDRGENRRYFNGKIATVSRINAGKIYVQFAGEENELEVEQETWRNIRYRYDREKDSIIEEETGTFKQYPLKLAWAITIHKSQGLTFEKAIIDAGASFAAGQVYVALSRLTSLQGLVLFSRIHPHCINTDERVLEFTRLEKSEDVLQKELEREQKVFIADSLLQSFDWTKFAAQVQQYYDDYEHRQLADKNDAVDWAKTLLDTVLQQQEMAVKFTKQLEQLLPVAEQDNYRYLHQRVTAACEYFAKALDENMQSIDEHTEQFKVKQRIRKYLKSLGELSLLPQRKKHQLQQAVQITAGLVKGDNATELLNLVGEQKIHLEIKVQETAAKRSSKPAKGESMRISLQLFKEGKSIADIAQQRGLAVSTIEGHLVTFISTGEIEVTDIVDEQKIAAILKAIETIDMEEKRTAPIKEKLGDEVSFNDIRAVLNYQEKLQQEV